MGLSTAGDGLPEDEFVDGEVDEDEQQTFERVDSTLEILSTSEK